MGWRVVRISGIAKLDYKMNYLVCRKCSEKKRVFVDEIAVLIIEDTSVSITTALMVKLVENKVAVIICDARHNPCFECVPFYGSYNTSLKVRDQVAWKEDNKKLIWSSVVLQKINNQMIVLKDNQKPEYKMLIEYASQMEFNDENNREGHAAKVYFNSLFGKDFSRRQDNPINAALNYGYAIILAIVNREIVCNGYITQLGIHHHNVNNEFNLGSDLVEPLRIFIDRVVLNEDIKEFNKEIKDQLVNVLVQEVIVKEKRYTLLDAIEIYCRSVLEAIDTGDVNRIQFIEEIGW